MSRSSESFEELKKEVDKRSLQKGFRADMDTEIGGSKTTSTGQSSRAWVSSAADQEVQDLMKIVNDSQSRYSSIFGNTEEQWKRSGWQRPKKPGERTESDGHHYQDPTAPSEEELRRYDYEGDLKRSQRGMAESSGHSQQTGGPRSFRPSDFGYPKIEEQDEEMQDAGGLSPQQRR